jgi:nucleoside-diphosphate-sugar epimerase
VRGTVRSLSNEQKVAHLRDLCPGSLHTLELVEADLNSAEGWAEAVQGATFVCHVASPFPLKTPKDKNDLIKPAVEGTLHVLRAAAAASPPPSRVVVTSSFAAIGYGQESNPDKPYNENDNWTVVDDPQHPINAYTESKTLAERAAWDFVESLPAEQRFELVTVNPSLVQGPMLSSNGCSSAQVAKDLLTGKVPVLADIDLFVTVNR